MKPFNKDLVKPGDPIIYRNGEKGKFVAYVPETYANIQITTVALEGIYEKCLLNHYIDGHRIDGIENQWDLFLPSTPVTMWINVYRIPDEYGSGGNLYKTREEALNFIKETCASHPRILVDTIQVTFNT